MIVASALGYALEVGGAVCSASAAGASVHYASRQLHRRLGHPDEFREGK